MHLLLGSFTPNKYNIKMESINSCECTKYEVKRKSEEDSDDRDPGFLENFNYYFAEYCRNTSLHGLKFLGEKGRSVVEKVWWLTVIAVSLYFCMVYIANTYQKWQMSPVIVNFATSQTPIFQIPFPAVTICPETKCDTRLFNFTDMQLKLRNNSLTPKETKLYGYMNLLCTSGDNANATIVDEEMLDFITEVAPTLKNTLWKCKWMTEFMRCSHLFVPVLTEAGVCFSFNILDHEEMFASDVFRYKNFQSTNKSLGWSAEEGYSEDDDIDSYPERARFSSAKTGLALTLETTKADIDYICSGGMQGYRVHLHHPADMPSIEEHYFAVPLNEVVSVAIKPRVMTTNDKLVSYPPDQRQCYFANEKSLRFFRIYTQQNCHVECLTNFTLNVCKCVAFYMPRTNSTPICGAGMKNCLLFAEGQFELKQVNSKIKRWVDDIPNNDINLNDSCDCLPACMSTSYDEETSQTPWDWEKYYDSEKFRQKIEERPYWCGLTPTLLGINPPRWENPSNSPYSSGCNDIAHYRVPTVLHLFRKMAYLPRVALSTRTQNSKLIIYFKDRQIMPSQRNELYGDTDFIASCGGLLGLFIGFSFISLIELIYFLTLRFACNLRYYGRYYWSGDPEMLKQQ